MIKQRKLKVLKLESLTVAIQYQQTQGSSLQRMQLPDETGGATFKFNAEIPV